MNASRSDLTTGFTTPRQEHDGGDVSVSAGVVGGQALAEGVVDEVHSDGVPVVFGFADGPRMLDDPRVVVQGDCVLHLVHPVRR